MPRDHTAKLVALRGDLALIDADLAAHPMNAPTYHAAQELIDAHRGEPPESIEALLTAAGLPGLAAHGSTTARGLLSFGRLHRRQRKLRARIEALERRVGPA